MAKGLRVVQRRSNFLAPPTVVGFVDDDGLPVPVMRERTLVECSRVLRAHRQTWGGAKVLLMDVGAKGPAGYQEDGIEEYYCAGVLMRFMRWERA